MGDGIEPILKGAVAAAVCVFAGSVHGGIDGASYDLVSWAHGALGYGVPVLGAFYTASSTYGLWTPRSRVNAFLVSGALNAGAALSSYWTARVVVGGIEKIIS